MKQNHQEQKIKQLFQQLRQDDERSAPSFAAEGETARRRRRTGAGVRLTIRFAVAAVLLAALTCGWLWLKSGWLAPDEKIAEWRDAISVPAPVPAPAILPGEPAAPTGVAGGSPVRRNTNRAPRASITLISQWRSPTGFLLKTSDEQLLKTIPKLDDSIVRVKAILKIENN